MTTDVANNNLESRRAIEALRNGVPNRYAVAELGSGQDAIESKFVQMLDRAAITDDAPSEGVGMLAAGDFGTGKSHLLRHLQTIALQNNFACSYVVVSKETPLFDMGKVFSAAIQHGRLPDAAGQMVEEAALKLRPDSESYTKFFLWAGSAESELHTIFPASLLVRERDADLDRSAAIERFWAGDRIKVSEVNEGLKAIGQKQSFSFRAPKAADLPPQRMRFVLELLKAAGYSGWVILIDELEIISNYTIIQRGRSYAEIARWMGQTEEGYPGLAVVGMTTPDLFASIVSADGKDDINTVPDRLKAWKNPASMVAAPRAETGMRLLQRIDANLRPPEAEMLAELYGKLRSLHSTAYDWDAPDIDRDHQPGDRIRAFVRRLITEWDLRRLAPGISPDIESTVIEFSRDEDSDLERASDDDDGRRGAD